MPQDFLNRLDSFLIGGAPQTVKQDDDLMVRLFEFVTELEPEQLTDEQADVLYSIIEDAEIISEDDLDEDYYEDEENDLDEAAPVRKRINKQVRRKRAMNYRKNKSKIKMKAKKYRRSARGKMMAKKAKIRAKSGKTATGKRKVHYV